MFEQPPGWTADKERERIRNLAVAYFGAKEYRDEDRARVNKLQDQRAEVLTVGVLVALVCLGITWVLTVIVAAILMAYWRYAAREIRSAQQSAASGDRRMKELHGLLDQVGLRPLSPCTVEKDGQVLGFVPRYEPEV